MSQTKVISINPKSIDHKLIVEAAKVLEQGGLVAFPTETVYGLGANLLNSDAMERLSQLKDRPRDKQFSIHIAEESDIFKYAVDILPRAYRVIDRFWPGPLTMVFAAPHGKTVGLRMPDNDIALRFLKSVDFPVVAPSANLAGQTPPSDAEGVLKALEGRIELVLDGGPTQLGVESTVLDATKLPFEVLREGYFKKNEVMSVAGQKTVLFVCTGNSCRSVMAQYLLEKLAGDKKRKDINVISAGTFAFFGMGPTHETLKLLQEQGIDASAHHAQRLTSDLVRQSDLILAMESRHKEDIVRQFPDAAGRVALLGDFVALDEPQIEINDPIGKSGDYYRAVFQKIKKAIEKLGDKI